MRFTGKERDAESGLDYFGARYFSGAQGRWTSPDWSEKPEPVPYADLHDPQSPNLYVYVKNNPLKNRDPDGHFCVFGVGNTCKNDPLPPPRPLLAVPSLGTTQLLRLSRQPRTHSNAGVALITKHEGYRGAVYNDSAGNPTIGYGHLIRKGEDFSKGVTRDQAAGILKGDAGTAEHAVNKNIGVWIPQNQFDALTSFTFNLGGGALARSTLNLNINEGNAVTKENFTDYNRAGGQEVQGLTDRREDEYEVFTGGK